jgi:hypothetical protein
MTLFSMQMRRKGNLQFLALLVALAAAAAIPNRRVMGRIRPAYVLMRCIASVTAYWIAARVGLGSAAGTGSGTGMGVKTASTVVAPLPALRDGATM